MATKKEANENMKLWQAVEKTDPDHTKRVNQRGGFTAIDATYQIKTATELWGPYGSNWSVSDLKYDYIKDSGGEIIEVSLNGLFNYPNGAFEMGADILYRPGNDTKKKLLTDLTTKALSKLGFNADVFMGKFDDNKYVQSLRQETVAPKEPIKEATPLDKARDIAAALKAAKSIAELNKVMRAYEDSGLQSKIKADIRTKIDEIINQRQKEFA